MNDDRRTEQGVPLRAELGRILDRLREPPDSPQRLVLPAGAKLQARIYGEYEDGTIAAGLGIATITSRGVDIEWNTAVDRNKSGRWRASTELTFTF